MSELFIEVHCQCTVSVEPSAFPAAAGVWSEASMLVGCAGWESGLGCPAEGVMVAQVGV